MIAVVLSDGRSSGGRAIAPHHRPVALTIPRGLPAHAETRERLQIALVGWLLDEPLERRPCGRNHLPLRHEFCPQDLTAQSRSLERLGCFTSPTPRRCGDDDHQVCLRTPLQEMGSRGAAELSSRLPSVSLLAR